MKQLEFCFAIPTLYPCDCIRCMECLNFTNRLHAKLNVDYNNSDIAKAIARAKLHLGLKKSKPVDGYDYEDPAFAKAANKTLESRKEDEEQAESFLTEMERRLQNGR